MCYAQCVLLYRLYYSANFKDGHRFLASLGDAKNCKQEIKVNFLHFDQAKKYLTRWKCDFLNVFRATSFLFRVVQLGTCTVVFKQILLHLYRQYWLRARRGGLAEQLREQVHKYM